MKFSTLTRITVPSAMVVFLTIEITEQQHAAGFLVYVIAAAAFLSSVGIELWGITAGENLKKAWANGAGKASTAVQMIAYVAVAGWMLRTNNTLLVLPLVAALAYVASAWADGYQDAEKAAADNTAWEREQLEKDREWQRQMDAKRLEIEAQNTLQIQLAHEKAQAEIAIAAEKTKATVANAEARKVKAKAEKEVAKVTETPSETKVNLSELSGSKLEIYKLFRQKPGASNTEIAETVGVSRQYVGQVKKELNGSLAS